MCLIKKDFIQTLYCFILLLGTASALKIFYTSFHSTENLENINHPRLFKLRKCNNRQPVY